MTKPELKMLEVFADLLEHKGFGEFRVEVRILKRGQKEVIIHCGRQYRYVMDNDEQTSDEASPLET